MTPADLHLSGWAAIAQIVLAITAICALLGAAIQIRLAQSASRAAITYKYTERFSGLAEHYLAATYRLFVLNEEDADKKFRAFFEDWGTEEQITALVLPNLIEELAGMYNNGLLHKRIADDFFGIPASDLWKLGWWFIDRYRIETGDRYYYRQWELMIVHMGHWRHADTPTARLAAG